MLYLLFTQMFIKNLLYVGIFTLLGDFEVQDASVQGVWQGAYSWNNIQRRDLSNGN